MDFEFNNNTVYTVDDLKKYNIIILKDELLRKQKINNIDYEFVKINKDYNLNYNNFFDLFDSENIINIKINNIISSYYVINCKKFVNFSNFILSNQDKENAVTSIILIVSKMFLKILNKITKATDVNNIKNIIGYNISCDNFYIDKNNKKIVYYYDGNDNFNGKVIYEVEYFLNFIYSIYQILKIINRDKIFFELFSFFIPKEFENYNKYLPSEFINQFNINQNIYNISQNHMFKNIKQQLQKEISKSSNTETIAETKKANRVSAIDINKNINNAIDDAMEDVETIAETKKANRINNLDSLNNFDINEKINKHTAYIKDTVYGGIEENKNNNFVKNNNFNKNNNNNHNNNTIKNNDFSSNNKKFDKSTTNNPEGFRLNSEEKNFLRNNAPYSTNDKKPVLDFETKTNITNNKGFYTNNTEIIQKYTINGYVIQDILPSKFNRDKFNYGSTSGRLELADIINTNIIEKNKATDFYDYNSIGSLLNIMKVTLTNPENYRGNTILRHEPRKLSNVPGVVGNNAGYVNYQACYPIEVRNNNVYCQTNSILMNCKMYNLTDGEYLLSPSVDPEYEIDETKIKEKLNKNDPIFKRLYDKTYNNMYEIIYTSSAYRELQYYKFIKEKLIKTYICPNFVCFYGNTYLNDNSINIKNINKSIIENTYKLMDEKYKYFKVKKIDDITKLEANEKENDKIDKFLNLFNEILSYNENNQNKKIFEELEYTDSQGNIIEEESDGEGGKKKTGKRKKKLTEQEFKQLQDEILNIFKKNIANQYYSTILDKLNKELEELKKEKQNEEIDPSKIDIIYNKYAFQLAKLYLNDKNYRIFKKFFKNEDGINENNLYFRDLTNYSDKALVILTESPGYSFYDWISKEYKIEGQIQKMIQTGYHTLEEWNSILFQLLYLYGIMLHYKIIIPKFNLNNNIFIKESKTDMINRKIWLYNIDGVDYYVPNLGFTLLLDIDHTDNLKTELRFGYEEGTLTGEEIKEIKRNDKKHEITQTEIKEKIKTKENENLNNYIITLINSFEEIIKPKKDLNNSIVTQSSEIQERIKRIFDDLNKYKLNNTPNYNIFIEYIKNNFLNYLSNRAGKSYSQDEGRFFDNRDSCDIDCNIDFLRNLKNGEKYFYSKKDRHDLRYAEIHIYLGINKENICKVYNGKEILSINPNDDYFINAKCYRCPIELEELPSGGLVRENRSKENIISNYYFNSEIPDL